MQLNEYVWINKDANIKAKINDEMILHFKWSKDLEADYMLLSRGYADSGFEILKDIIEGSHNNRKYDTWFLPAVYLMRQSIELILKAGLSGSGMCKKDLQDVFVENKHNVIGLYNVFRMNFGVANLSTHEQMWLEKYLNSIEVIDSKSDLFRYPFKDEFMEQYGNKSLDIFIMSNRLMYCYSVLNKMLYGKWYENIIPQLNEDAHFFQVTDNNINNCYLWNSPHSDGFYKQIEGYRDVAVFLFQNFESGKEEKYFYPIAFLMRNAIEIGLKRLLHIKMAEGIEKKKNINFRNSHLLYKDLWQSIKPMLIHYAKKSKQNLEDLEIAEQYIISLDTIDKKGDTFRYPCSFSHEYKCKDYEVDVFNFFEYMLSLFYFIDSCNTWLKNQRDFENEMMSEY
jgi:hypothetical protein